MVRYFLLGLALGVSLWVGVLYAASLPHLLGYGRTTGNVNKPWLASSDGTLHTN